ncbi:hypothetical protein MLD38_012136 [Melastoma candidum]|uniref:Uncharacterized protein n=1 Tax=Melastoma candidum TaxID=119954 RepID=A0ACB9R5B8_9MYRT|nr:hypothetical protein MLD38_012136 [Melastoma candidum]
MGLSLIPMEQGSGLGSGNLSLSTWTYQIGLEGEQQELDKLSAANSSLWKNGQPAPRNKNLIWYKYGEGSSKGKWAEHRAILAG